MENEELQDIAKRLGTVVEQKKAQALQSLKQLPEGALKTRLAGLMDRASSGEVSLEDAQREIKKIIQDVGKG